MVPSAVARAFAFSVLLMAAAPAPALLLGRAGLTRRQSALRVARRVVLRAAILRRPTGRWVRVTSPTPVALWTRRTRAPRRCTLPVPRVAALRLLPWVAALRLMPRGAVLRLMPRVAAVGMVP